MHIYIWFLLSFELCAFHFSQHTCAQRCAWNVHIKLYTDSVFVSSCRLVGYKKKNIYICVNAMVGYIYVYGIKKRANATQMFCDDSFWCCSLPCWCCFYDGQAESLLYLYFQWILYETLRRSHISGYGFTQRDMNQTFWVENFTLMHVLLCVTVL